MKFNKEKHKVLYSRRNNHRHLQMLGVTQMKNTLAEKDLEVLVVTKYEPAVHPCSQEGKWYPGLH